MTTDDWRQLDAAHHMAPFTDYRELRAAGSRIITHADGHYIYDSDGNRILDAMAGLWCVNVGYGRQELVDAANKTAILDSVPFLSGLITVLLIISAIPWQ